MRKTKLSTERELTPKNLLFLIIPLALDLLAVHFLLAGH